MLRNKKGIALNQAFAAVLALVLVSVLVIVGIVVLASIRVSFPVATVTVVAQDFGAVSHAPILSGNASACRFGAFTVSVITNTSAGGYVIPATNYTVVASNGTIAYGDGICCNGTNWFVNATYEWGTEACSASDTMLAQFATYPALVGLVGTIIFLGLVIGVLVASFVFGGKRGV